MPLAAGERAAMAFERRQRGEQPARCRLAETGSDATEID